MLAFVALFIVSIGNGGLRPCIVSLGGDQFDGDGKIHILCYITYDYRSEQDFIFKMN